MEITPLPIPPSTASPENFDTRADNFLSALPQFQQELNEFGASLNSLSTNSASTTSLSISVAEKTLTVEAGKSYFTGMSVKIASTTNGSLWMIGDVLSYNATSGALVVDVQAVQGSGTYSSWSISLSFNGIVTPEQAPGLATLEQANQQAFLLRAIGEPFGIWTHLTGCPIPSNAGDAKFIKLTAGESGAGQYNEGLLVSESVSGSSPEISATAQISFPSSPINGQTIELLNTSRKFRRPGVSGVSRLSKIKAHTHPAPQAGVFNAPDGTGAAPRISVGSTGLFGEDETAPTHLEETCFVRIA